MATPKVAKIPSLIYGTAWKKDQTRHLVKQALLAGFRGVDTAAQPKHYQEHLVGEGIRDAMKEGGIEREDLYVSIQLLHPIATASSLIPESDPNKIHLNPRPGPLKDTLRPKKEHHKPSRNLHRVLSKESPPHL